MNTSVSVKCIESKLLKCTQPRKIFFAQSNLPVIRSIWAQKFFNLLESSIFYALWLEVLHDRVLGSLERRLLMTSTQEPNTMAPQSALCICSRKWKAKLIVPIYFGTKTSEFCLIIISFSSLKSELSLIQKTPKQTSIEHVQQL